MRNLRFGFRRQVGAAEDVDKRVIVAGAVFVEEGGGCLDGGSDGVVDGGGEGSQLEGCEGVWARDVGVFYYVCCHYLFVCLFD